jgi:antitoxin MazE
MNTQIKKWGNSLALRIPKALAEEIDISTDTYVDLSIVDGRLVIKPITEPDFTLEELLAGISESNLHREVDTGVSVGNEVW